MLLCKDCVVIAQEKGEPIVVDYTRTYLTHSAADSVKTFSKTFNKKELQRDGQKWEGTQPEAALTAKTDAESVAALMQEALSYAVDNFGDKNEFKTLTPDVKGLMIILKGFDYAADLWTRAKVSQENRPKPAEDPAKAHAALIDKMVADAKARGKVLTKEQAEARLAKLAALEAEEENS